MKKVYHDEQLGIVAAHKFNRKQVKLRVGDTIIQGGDVKMYEVRGGYGNARSGGTSLWHIPLMDLPPTRRMIAIGDSVNTYGIDHQLLMEQQECIAEDMKHAMGVM